MQNVTLFIGTGSGKLKSMNKILSLIPMIFFGLLAAFITPLEAREELTVIQTVSKDRRSFIIAKGLKDGISKGQEIVFANENVSIVCKASLVNRDFSLWTPLDKTITIPFNKEEIISSNSTVYGNIALDIASSTDSLVGTSVLPSLEENEFLDFIKGNTILAKIGYNRGLSQSSSSVSDEKNTTRTGYNFSAEYNWKLKPEFEWGVGARIDHEVFRITEPELDIPTNRKMLITSATYYFLSDTRKKTSYYFSLAAGLGSSETTVDEEVAKGMVTLLPEVRIGYQTQLLRSMALVFEGSIESLSTNEKFSDGTEQTSDARNLKLTIGLRF